MRQYMLVAFVAVGLAGFDASSLDFGDPVAIDLGDLQSTNALRVASDGAGRAVAVWRSTIDFTRVNLLTSLSNDGGATWGAYTQINPATDSSNVVPGGAAIATDQNGNWLVVWVSAVSIFSSTIRSATSDTGTDWVEAAPVAIASTGFDIFGLDLATDGRGAWIAVWAQSGDSDDVRTLWASTSTDNAATWSTPVGIRQGWLIHPRIRANVNGTWVVVWQFEPDPDLSESDVEFARSTDGGLTWSPAQVLNSSAHTSVGANGDAALAADDNSTWVVLWSTTGDLATAVDSDIAMTRSTDDGVTWSEAVLVNADTETLASEFHPDVATDGSGHWIAAWTVDADGPWYDFDDDLIAVESSDAGLSWGMPAGINALAQTDAAYDDDNRVHVISTMPGRWMAAWEQSQNNNPPGHMLLEPRIAVATAAISDDDSSNGGACFIATAAYGTPMAHQLNRLRSVRDRNLLTWSAGSAVVDAYYRLSPDAAAWIAPRPVARAVTRATLVPFVSADGCAVALLALAAVVVITGRKIRVGPR